MPRRSMLSPAELAGLVAVPTDGVELARWYEFSEGDLTIIGGHRGPANRLGFAVQLAYMRFPGVIIGPDEQPDVGLVRMVADQVNVPVTEWATYGRRAQTRREHLVELRDIYGYRLFTVEDHPVAVDSLVELALRTDKGIVLAEAIIDGLRERRVLLPSVTVIERICAEAATKANRQIYETLTGSLTIGHRQRIDALLDRKDDSAMTWLGWLRQPAVRPNSRHILDHLGRLQTLRDLALPDGVDRLVHQNRLTRIAREGGQMTPADLARFEPQRRYATLVAVVIEAIATITDEIIDLHDRSLGKAFATAKTKHRDQFHASGRAINDKVRLYSQIGQALVAARHEGRDPYTAIEAVIGWDAFTASVTEAADLAQPESFDFLALIVESYPKLRRYSPAFLDAFDFQAAPAVQAVIDAIDVLRSMNRGNLRKVPADAPTSFITKRWEKLVNGADGVDRRFYELCVMAELRNGLRSGDISVRGSRQYKDFDDYLIPPAAYTELKTAGRLPVKIDADCGRYLQARVELLAEQFEIVNRLAAADELPDAVITDRLKIVQPDSTVPDAAQALIDLTAGMLPHIKITELLVEVDQWTDIARHFSHLKTGGGVKDKTLLFTTILADAINLGLTKMSESCPGTTYPKLAWLQAWHIRDETYSAALAELVNALHRHPFATHWGDGTTSSSDGQRYRAAGRAQSTGHVNLRYGTDPGRTIYTHISDRYAPFHTKVINVGVRDSTYVLDGLLYHDADLTISEHYTDTNGFTDHVFGLMHLLGYRFAPRIRDLADTKLYTPTKTTYEQLKPLIGGPINIGQIRAHWDDILRLASSIEQGTVTASLMLRKLGSYPRQNGLATALREFGRIERTLFILDWLQNVELRQRVHAGLNKGEARNALARAVFFNRLGEIRDRTYEHQRHRASGLNLVTAAIALWNTVYLDRAVTSLTGVDANLLSHLSPLGWEHINLTGDYTWKTSPKTGNGRYRALRTPNP